MDKTLCVRFVSDAVFLLVTIVMSFTLNNLFHFPPKGINCGDISIQKKYKQATISYTYSTLAFCIFPLIFLILSEIAIFPWKDKRQPMLKTFMKAYSILTVFVFGLFAQSALVTFLQRYTRQHRPHFLEVCKPNLTCSFTDYTYKEHFECTGDPILVKEARQSFPSSLAARSALSMAFLIIYVQSRFNCETTPYGKWVIQIALLLASLTASITRVTDNQNHWGDVYGGLIIGTCSATFFANSVQWFKMN